MTAKQTVKTTQTKTIRTTTTRRGLAAVGTKKAGRPAGSKDTKPRKPRSDKGKKRKPYGKRTNATRS